MHRAAFSILVALSLVSLTGILGDAASVEANGQEASSAETAAALLEIIDPQGVSLLPGAVVTTTLGGPWNEAATAPVYATIVSSRNFTKMSKEESYFGNPIADFHLNDRGADLLFDFTSNHVGGMMTFVLGKRVISTVSIYAAISKEGRIDGLSPDEIDQVIKAFKSGSMSEPFVVGAPVVTDSYARVLLDPRAGWQATGILVEPGAEFPTDFTVYVLGGQWTDSESPTAYVDGDGLRYVCARSIPADQCVEPMPDYPRNALIGKVGDQLIGAGTYAMPSLGIEQGGELYLRINEEDAALFDNAGAIVIEIQGNISSI